MKKIIYAFLAFVFLLSTTYAMDYSCFEYSGTLTGVENKTIKVITDNVNNYYFQDNKLLNTKILKNYQKKYFGFRILTQNGFSENKTNFEIQFNQYEQNKEIILKFDITLLKNSFNYEFLTDNYYYNFYISKDGQSWQKIEDNLKNYDLHYLKIAFENKNLRSTTISNLSFFENGNNEILVNTLSNSDINVYNNYICDNLELTKLISKTRISQYFPVDINTKTFTLSLLPNPNFNPNHIIQNINKDTDNDGIIDIEDNCIYDFNPNQLDSTATGIGDICSDKDNDGFFGNVDNCPTLYNPDQKDENKNGIGDACEKDSDGDKIFDSIDNCINTYNPDQEDSDFDGIGDLCDNCKNVYNSDQKDFDGDGIGNFCDKEDNRFIESNKYFFIGIILVIILIFFGGISFMVYKVRSSN